MKIEKTTGSRDEQDIYFILHPFEKSWIERLDNSPMTILVDGKQVKAMELSGVYQDAKSLGYLDEEVDALLAILKARGITDQQQVSGTKYLYLVETSINFADLTTKLDGIEDSVTLAESNGFTYQCNNLSSARTLVGTLGIENDEGQKDELRQNLNLAEVHLKNKCAEWLKTGHENLRQKINVLEPLHLQIPPVLDQNTGHPVTDFSQILFQSVQSEVKRAYTKISERIRKIQGQVREICDQEVVTYQSDQRPCKAIEAASRLQQACCRVDTEIKELNQKREETQELYRLFEQWRALAHQIEGNRQLMVNTPEDSAVKNLIDRLDDIQRKIRQHIATDRPNLKYSLSNYEHFQTLVMKIKTEFDEFLGGKEKAFIAYHADIEKLLRDVIDTPHIIVKWNPADSEGCYRDTREKAVEKLRDVIETILSKLDNLTRDLQGPIKTYAVPASLKTSAMELRQDIKKYTEEFQKIRSDLIAENLDQQLSDWISELVSLRQKGEGILNRQQEIEKDMAGFRNQLNPSTQRLHDAVNPLLENRTFNSPQEIVERLRELYQLDPK